MEKFSKSQIVKVVLFLLLLLFIPFISSSLRPSYLYFLLNILIVDLVIEAGFLNAISGPRDEKKPVTTVVKAPISAVDQHVLLNNVAYSTGARAINSQEERSAQEAVKPAERTPAPEKKVITVTARSVQKVKRCPSKPSIFFIGGSEADAGFKEEEDKEKWAEAGELSKQELFAKADLFISNFYKQLKLQREESWKKIHGLYHRAF